MSAAEEWDGLLDPGERIIWQGQPSAKVTLEFDSIFVFCFMLVWGGIPLAGVIAHPASLALVVPALFVAVALHYFVGQHFWKAFQPSRTFYSLTDKRAFIAYRGFRGRKLDSYPNTPDTTLKLVVGRKNAVWFAQEKSDKALRNSNDAKLDEIGFERLDDPRAVYQLLRAVQRGDA